MRLMNLRGELTQCWLWKLGALLKKHSVVILLIIWQQILIKWKARAWGVASLTRCPMPLIAGVGMFAQDITKRPLCFSSFWYSIFGFVTIEGTTSSCVHMCSSIHMPSDIMVASGWVECCEMSSIVLGCQGGGGEGIIRFPTKKECALDNRGLLCLFTNCHFQKINILNLFFRRRVYVLMFKSWTTDYRRWKIPVGDLRCILKEKIVWREGLLNL